MKPQIHGRPVCRQAGKRRWLGFHLWLHTLHFRLVRGGLAAGIFFLAAAYAFTSLSGCARKEVITLARPEFLRALALGRAHGCALAPEGHARCWGGRTPQRFTVSFPSPARSLSSLEEHTCALLENGKTACFGKNDAGQLGNGTRNESKDPVLVLSAAHAVSVCAGARHSCALESGGKVKCWGANDYGQLGDGTTNDRARAGNVARLSKAASLSCGSRHTCAVTRDGKTMCWGLNYSGQLGTGSNVGPENCGVGGTSYSCSTVPVETAGLRQNTKRVLTGRDFSCAMTKEGKLFCWGENWDGQLGTGKNVWIETCGAGGLVLPCSAKPVEASVLKGNVKDAALGKSHGCALFEDGGIACWGNNAYGQLGSGTTRNSFMPVRVSGVSSVRELSSGENHACALLEDGKIKCWGSSAYGQLGAGDIKTKMSCGNAPCSPLPVDVTGL